MSDAPRPSLLQQREIEARIVAPLIRAFIQEFGPDRVLSLLEQVIGELANQAGAELAKQSGENTLTAFAQILNRWTEGGALELRLLEQTEDHLSFDVTRCQYAEMYRSLGLHDLGTSLSCCRDGALMEGFNPMLRLKRTQTIMQGASFCDFRFERGAIDDSRREGPGDPVLPPE